MGYQARPDARPAAHDGRPGGQRRSGRRLPTRGPPGRAGDHSRHQAVQAGLPGVEARVHGGPPARRPDHRRRRRDRDGGALLGRERARRSWTQPGRSATPARPCSAPAPSSLGARRTPSRDWAEPASSCWPVRARKPGCSIVTEAMDAEGLDQVLEVADIVQIGARNMQNYSLLEARRPRSASRCCSSAASRPPSGAPALRRVHPGRGQPGRRSSVSAASEASTPRRGISST